MKLLVPKRGVRIGCDVRKAVVRTFGKSLYVDIVPNKHRMNLVVHPFVAMDESTYEEINYVLDEWGVCGEACELISKCDQRDFVFRTKPILLDLGIRYKMVHESI